MNTLRILTALSLLFFAAGRMQAQCHFNLTPNTQLFPASGGSNSVTVSATATDCTWTAVSNDAWITISAGDSGTGDGAVDYTIDANSGAPRIGTMTIAG